MRARLGRALLKKLTSILGLEENHHDRCRHQAEIRTSERGARQGARADGRAQCRCRQAQYLGAHGAQCPGPARVVYRYGRRIRRRTAGERPRRGQSDQDAALPMALEGLCPVPGAHRIDRQAGRRVAHRVCRSPEHSPDQSGSRRPPAGHHHDADRDLDLHARRRRARAYPQRQCQPDHPVGPGRLHQCGGRALRGRPRRPDHHPERDLARPRQ